MPEEVDWRDEGCDLFPSCLGCPLPRCLEETSRGRQHLRMSDRARHMARLKASGRSTCDIARLFGVTSRTVQRSLAKIKAYPHSEKAEQPKDLSGRAGEILEILRLPQADSE